MRELVKRAQKGTIITLVNPGLCNTDFTRDISNPIQSASAWMLKVLLARTSEIGSRTLVAGICAGIESHGEYMSDCKNQEVAEWIRTPKGMQVQETVYHQLLAVLEAVRPGICACI